MDYRKKLPKLLQKLEIKTLTPFLVVRKYDNKKKGIRILRRSLQIYIPYAGNDFTFTFIRFS
jgi:hypothetical protein